MSESRTYVLKESSKEMLDMPLSRQSDRYPTDGGGGGGIIYRPLHPGPWEGRTRDFENTDLPLNMTPS